MACSAPVATVPTVKQASATLSHSPPGNAILVPSGDQAMARSVLSRSVSVEAAGADSTDEIVATSGSGSPLHDAGNSTSAVGAGVVLDTRYTPGPPVQDSAENAIEAPSGDHAGPPAARSLTWRLPEPSAFMTQTVLLCTYAMRRPS